MLCVLFGLHGARYLGALPGMSGPGLLVTLSSGLGAATYAVLIRLFWIDDLSPKAIFSLTLGCMLAILAALLCGSSFLRPVGELWFAAVWWIAFSTGLGYQERLVALLRRVSKE
jgi:drug/metabolite transporter (DMT)-like permease